MGNAAKFTLILPEELDSELAVYIETRKDRPSKNQVIREAIAYFLARVVTGRTAAVTEAERNAA